MSDFLQNSTGDLIFTNNELTLVEAADEVKQRLNQRLRTFRCEWFLDLDAGVPYYQDILVKNPSTIKVEGSLKQEISNTPGVIDILFFEFEIEKDTRVATVRTRVKSVDGPIELEVII